jgi:hypothetical protein
MDDSIDAWLAIGPDDVVVVDDDPIVLVYLGPGYLGPRVAIPRAYR